MLKQLFCLNLLIPHVDPRRESPLRAVHRAAADLMVGAINGKLSDEDYEARVTGLVASALLKDRPVHAHLRSALGQLLALHPSDRAKVANRDAARGHEDSEQGSDLPRIQQVLESLTTIIVAREGFSL